MGILRRLRAAVPIPALIVFSLLACKTASAADIVIRENAGIENVISLGDNVNEAVQAWGRPDRIVTQENKGTFSFYEYHRQGITIMTDKDGVVLGMTFFCTLPSASNALWKGPLMSAAFTGRTGDGLTVSADTTIDNITAVYGKPEASTLSGAPTIPELIQRGISFLINDQQGGVTLVYPRRKLVFSTYRGRLENVSLLNQF